MNWKPYYNEILERYNNGESPADIANSFKCGRTSIKNIIQKQGKLRTQSESSKLAAQKGKKDYAISRFLHSAKTDNRFNPLKSNKKEKHPKWVKDRSLLKSKRNMTEERHFFRQLIDKRGFKCEITGLNGTLSVHHIKGVWSNPELMFDENNCIVVLKNIHLKFHKIYGNKSTKSDWDEFVSNNEFKEYFEIVNKRKYTPKVDLSGKRHFRLLILGKEGKKWLCLCDCGTKKLVSTGNFKSTKSCGCYKKELDLLRFKKTK